jgi:hypothetical protein
MHLARVCGPSANERCRINGEARTKIPGHTPIQQHRMLRGIHSRRIGIPGECWSGRSIAIFSRDDARSRHGKSDEFQFLAPEDCGPENWRSSRRQTSQSTTRGRSRTFRKGRTG